MKQNKFLSRGFKVWWFRDTSLRSTEWPSGSGLARSFRPSIQRGPMSPPNTWHAPWNTRSANPPKTKRKGVGQEYIPIFAAGGLLTHSFSIAPHRARGLPSAKVVVMVGEDNRLKITSASLSGFSYQNLYSQSVEHSFVVRTSSLSAFCTNTIDSFVYVLFSFYVFSSHTR